MTGFPGRNGRRRRVLNEEVLSASTSHAALRAIRDEEVLPETPRYSEAAGVEHHPQITDFIPRRYRSIVLFGASGLATIAALVALNVFATPISRSLGRSSTAPFDLNVPGSLADWASSVAMLMGSLACWIIFFLRRHRIDDIRGRYRVWFLASIACLVMSVDCVAELHALLVSAGTYATGWGALRDGAAWWLALAGVPAVWIGARAILDAKDCRLAGALLMASGAAYLIALASYLGWITLADPRIESSIGVGARLLGHWSLFVGLVVYARYVILDAQGLIPVRVIRGKTARDNVSGSRANRASIGRRAEAGFATETSHERTSGMFAARETEWVDGSSPESVDYDSDEDDQDGGGRKLSKADRKRLRKLKDQQRAA